MILLIAKIIFLIAFPILAGIRDYLIMPVKLEVSKDWHSIGFILRIPAFFMLIPYYSWMPVKIGGFIISLVFSVIYSV